MANTVNNVSVGKPKVGGAIFRAPLGTTLPTSPTSELPEVWASLGYCSEDGVTNDNAPETTDIKAWGGDTVLNVQTEKKDTFGVTFIEALNIEVLKAMYGDDNVSGTLATGISLNANVQEVEASAWVIDMILREGAIKRICIPNGKLSDLDTITYADEEAIGYGSTITAMPDTEGNTHYEYIQRVTTAPAESE